MELCKWHKVSKSIKVHGFMFQVLIDSDCPFYLVFKYIMPQTGYYSSEIHPILPHGQTTIFWSGGWGGEFWDITFFSLSGLFCFGRQKPVKGLFNKKEIGPGWWEAFDQFFPMTLKCRNFLLEIAQPHFPPSQKHDGLIIHPCLHSSRIGCAVLWFWFFFKDQ